MAKNNKLNQWSLTLLRVTVGIIFIYHGYFKLFVSGGFNGTIDFLTQIGVPYPIYFALIVGVAEFFGGILLLIGLFTRLASLVLITDMLVAFFKVHLKQGFFITPKTYGYEFVLLILATLFALLIGGSGMISVGRLFKRKR